MISDSASFHILIPLSRFGLACAQVERVSVKVYNPIPEY